MHITLLTLFQFVNLAFAWTAFSYAVGNLATDVVAYIRKEAGSTGLWAIVRLFMIGAAFAVWWSMLKS